MLFKEKTNNIVIKIFRLLPSSIHVSIVHVYICMYVCTHMHTQESLLRQYMNIRYKTTKTMQFTLFLTCN